VTSGQKPERKRIVDSHFSSKILKFKSLNGKINISFQQLNQIALK